MAGHPFNKFRQSNVERSRAGALTSGYKSGGKVHKDAEQDRALIKKMVGKDLGDIGGVKAAMRSDRPRRASGGKVGKKATTVVNVITGGSQQPPAPPPMPMPPPGAMAPPPGPPPGPPPSLAGAGPMPPPGGPPMPMRARGGKVGAGSGGTKVQHDVAKEEVGKLNRPRVVTFATGGGVVSFKAAGGRVPMPKPRPQGSEPQPSDLYSASDAKRMETQRARGGRIESPDGVAKATKLPGGAGGGKGRLAKAREY